MLVTNILLLASTTAAFSLPDVSTILPLFARKDGGSGSSGGSGGSGGKGGSGTCPSVWTSISKELKTKFLSGGQCTPDARAAIRLVFHDCGGMFVP